MPFSVQGQEFLGPYIDQWDQLRESPLDDIQWQRPRRESLGDGLQRLTFSGRSGHFRSMVLTPIVLVADHENPREYQSEGARLLLASEDSFGINEAGEFRFTFDLRPAVYRFHVTFSTLAGERLSYLLIVNLRRDRAGLRRYTKQTHNIGIERFLTYEEILERADHEAYVQTQDIEGRLEELYRARRRNFIYIGLGGALLSYSQNIPAINTRTTFTTTHIPQISLGIDYNFGRDFYVIGELRHQFTRDPELAPFTAAVEQKMSWSAQSIHGHYLLPFWGRRFDVITGFSRTRYPFYRRETRRTLFLDKEEILTGVIGVKGRWILSERTQLQLQALLRPVLLSDSEANLREQEYYSVGFSIHRNLRRDWRATLEGSFDKYSVSRDVFDPVDNQIYAARTSMLQTYLILRLGRTF